MAKSILNNIEIGVSELTGDVYLYRHGKQPGVALEKRDAEAEVLLAIVKHMMHDAPKGAARDVFIKGVRYEISVRPMGKMP